MKKKSDSNLVINHLAIKKFILKVISVHIWLYGLGITSVSAYSPFMDVNNNGSERNFLKFSTDDTQTFKVSGIVIDENGIPLPSVTIQEEGTNNGTLTDFDGNFIIEVKSKESILIFTYIGMETIRRKVGGESSITVQMEVDSEALDEVVIVGYGTQKRENITGSVGVVTTEQIAQVPVGNVTTSLAGKVAGLQVMNRQGRPGNDQSEISIRGFGQPLVVVDGIQQEGFGNIDPNSIESITVLKDASASIYGARAGNGVVLVNTKRGTLGAPVFNFTSAYTISSPTRLVEFADAATYATLKNEANIADGLAPLYTEEEIERFKSGNDPAYPNTDWWERTFKEVAPMQDYNLNARGGSESILYFASLGYKDQGSMLRSNDLSFKRYDFRSNVDVKFSDPFSATFDLNYRIEQGYQPGFNSGGQGGGPFPSVMEAIQRAKPTIAYEFPDPNFIPFAGYEGLSNPVALSQRKNVGYVDDFFQRFNGLLSLKYDFEKLITGLSIGGSFNYGLQDREVKRWTTGFTYYTFDYDAETYIPETNYNNGRNTLRNDFTRDINWQSNLRMDYHKIFDEKHNISGMVLYELISEDSHFNWLYREGFLSKDLDQFFAGSDVNKDNGGSAFEDGRSSLVGRFNYNFSSKYLVDLLFRYDASARFSPDNRWGFFPGISLAWRLSEEDFLSNNKVVDQLKLRASYGEAGDEANIRFNYLTGYNIQGNYAFGLGEVLGNGISSKGLANPDAIWAKTKTYNIGLDSSLWRDLFSLQLDVFYREKTGILASRIQSVPSTFGAHLPEENLNSLNDRGFELAVGHKNQIGNISYFMNGNVSWTRSKWSHYDEPNFDNEEEAFRYRLTDTWRNVTWGYATEGLFLTQEEIDNWADITNGANNNVIKPGDIKYTDINNDGQINWLDERVIGKSDMPSVFFGVNTGFSYKNLNFSMLWQGGAGYSKFYNSGFRAPFRVDQVPFQFWENRWTEENNNANNSLPRIRNGQPTSHPNTDRPSTFWMIEDAYFVKLREARIAYKVPINLNITFFLAGTNLATITNVLHLDPEASNQNFNYYPQQKTFSLGLSTQF